MPTNIATALENVNGTSFVSITTSTEPTLKGGKSNPMKGRVRKIMTGASIMVFQNKNSSGYNNMVKRRLEQEGKDPASFELGPRKWGSRIPNTPFIHHIKEGVDKYYLEAIFLKSGEVHYEVDGVETPAEDIEGLTIRTEETSEQGGLSNKVVIRTFAIDSITSLRAFGEEYTDLYYE